MAPPHISCIDDFVTPGCTHRIARHVALYIQFFGDAGVGTKAWSDDRQADSGRGRSQSDESPATSIAFPSFPVIAAHARRSRLASAYSRSAFDALALDWTMSNLLPNHRRFQQRTVPRLSR